MSVQVLPNFSICCRLCLSDTLADLRSIFDEGVDSPELQQKISSSLGVEITLEDKLTTMVCSDCVEKVHSWTKFHIRCTENQSKLQQWMSSSLEISQVKDNGHDISITLSEIDTSISIKEEPVDTPLSPEIVMGNGDSHMKQEPLDEDFSELPPQLTPHNEENDIAQLEGRKCSVCPKILSSVANRKKHERVMHGIRIRGSIRPSSSATDSDRTSLATDDRSQSSIDSQPMPQPTDEEGKILFAAGLKLLQKNATPLISQESLSKMELSYMEKCKAMVTMHQSLKCACHGVTHINLKGLLSHLRSLRFWFPIFTCYHCMITFTDRSSSTRHYVRCPHSNLETLIKLSNLKKRSEVKTRLYQLFKCTECKFMYSFHEDYCTHVDEDHSQIELPHQCSCGRRFNSLEDYKDHVYVGCMVEYYCDVCFTSVKTLDAFQKHAAEMHDNADGFVLLQDDNYRQRRSLPAVLDKVPVKREYTDESNIVTGKRRISYRTPIIDEEEEKVVNPISQKVPGTVCPICNKRYSSNNNMWRHYKTHLERNDTGEQNTSVTAPPEDEDDSVYCCPDCGGMFNSSEWEKHKETHKKMSCKECGKVFQFQSELEQHRTVHLNLKVYRDSKTQAYKSTMASPTGENTSNVVLLCEICDRMFTSKEKLLEHKLQHEKMPVLSTVDDPEMVVEVKVEKKRFACPSCDKSYNSYASLWDHKKKKHTEGGSPQGKPPPRFAGFPKKCKYCAKEFFTGGSLFMHQAKHEREKDKMKSNKSDDDAPESYFTCKRCFKVFATRGFLKSHMKSHKLSSPPGKSSKKSTKRVWCDVCHSAFENLAQLTRHKNEDHDTEDSMPALSDQSEEVKDEKSTVVFTCDICTEAFKTRVQLRRHKEKHTQGAKNNCKICKISFGTPSQLTTHMREEHAEALYSCKTCGKTYNSITALNTHQGWHKRGKNKEKSPGGGGNAGEFPCSRCRHVCPNETALQIHILEKHRKINAIPLRCKMCNLDFKKSDDYEKHKRFHAIIEQQSMKKQFSCGYCTLEFTKSESLALHIKQAHGERSIKAEFKCPHCERSFDKSSTLSVHLKVHEKLKGATVSMPKSKFSCSICNKGFELPKDLRAHTIQAHPF